MNSIPKTVGTRGVRAVKGDVGEIAAITVDLIARGCGVSRRK
ncbi:hypothetical protein P3T23_008039 [Paraburkholderia sp. GAS448]